MLCDAFLQALYSCRPFREQVLAYGGALPKDADENLLNCLADLFMQVWTGSCVCVGWCLLERLRRRQRQ
jgi:hypothetical protein